MTYPGDSLCSCGEVTLTGSYLTDLVWDVTDENDPAYMESGSTTHYRLDQSTTALREASMTEIPQHKDPSVQRLMDAIFWEPSEVECEYCCMTPATLPIPAQRGMWFTVSGDMLLDSSNEPLPPHTVLHRVCNPCAEQVREEQVRLPRHGMTLVADREIG